MGFSSIGAHGGEVETSGVEGGLGTMYLEIRQELRAAEVHGDCDHYLPWRMDFL